MKSVVEILEEKISKGLAHAAGLGGFPAIVKPATDPKFGDYQVNGVMAAAKQIKTNPRKLAEEVVSKINAERRTPNTELLLSDICEPPEVAGPGFINLRLKGDFVSDRLLEVGKDSTRLGIDKAPQSKNIVVDFSSPNIAKEMHVGHLRSTIIGDCICRLLEFLGHDVKRQNHIGDWGTQFGMLCAFFIERLTEAGQRGEVIEPDKTLADIEGFYREAHSLYETDEEFAKTARAAVVGLHTGNEMWMRYWNIIVATTSRHFREIYNCLGVILGDEHTRGESFYKNMLGDVVEKLKKKGLAVESEGAVCVFPEGFRDKDSKPLPMIVQKSDGAYLYATTDLAAIRYRVNELKADRIVYVTDARQKLHFEMLFAVARMAGWDIQQKTADSGQRTENGRQKTEFVHVTFGSVLGENGKPLKTREGENVKLKELLDESVQRAFTIVEQKNPELSDEKKEKIAKAVGIGAVKYSDFSNNRTSDYVFSFNKMLAMDGNTAPYMQYAYARVKSIGRKAQERGIDVEDELADIKTVSLTEPTELDLAKQLIRYGEAVESAAADYRPNYLTAYLYELAQKFSAFYTNCPVLDAGLDKRPTRLLLCDLTARIIEHGLNNLLGIKVVEQM
jgi:arginyl-tRNA synthetase